MSNFKGGQAPEVWVGSTDAGASFAALGAPVGNGAAAAVDVSTLPLFKTVQIGGTFRGEVIVEISEDGGVTWGQPFPGFQAPGFASEILAADFMRVRRVGVPANTPGLPIVNVGACDVGGGGGGGSGNPQLFEYVAVGGEANPFTIAAAQGFVARATNTYQVQVTLKRPAANAIKILVHGRRDVHDDAVSGRAVGRATGRRQAPVHRSRPDLGKVPSHAIHPSRALKSAFDRVMGN